jgi:signal transduction histidine kinase
MISHQFRTPLALVDSALQRLIRRRDHLTPAEILERGTQARSAIARLVRLVESTLDAARLDAGQIEVRSQACDLGLLVADICTRQAEDLGGRRITVTPPVDGPPIAYCDPVHAEHILTNLLSNAVKYSPKETLIGIGFTVEQSRIACIVTNTGSLGGALERDALFDRYYRGSNTEGCPGIGVGLYMAKALARLQGGDVCLQASEPGTVRMAMMLPCSACGSGVVAAASVAQEPA